jgi:hypothetical protein
VILETPDIIREMMPGIAPDVPLSVACVRTTHPKYLVFGRDASRPLAVVQFGPAEEMARIDEILTRLHCLLPDAIARPLACGPWRGRWSMQAQSGLPGMPWFRISERFRTRERWDRLREDALEILTRLHAAIRTVPEWSCAVRPGDELRRQATLCEERGIITSPRATLRIDAAGEALDAMGEVRCTWQHGDFCVNNLLISEEGLAIIDFEEFGGTAVPLHDHFGLALSIHALSSDVAGRRSLGEELAACLRTGQNARPISEDLLPGLFLHHLLWRINQGLDRHRNVLVEGLIGIVEQFATSPSGPLFADEITSSRAG